jgi:hypothetical protein
MADYPASYGKYVPQYGTNTNTATNATTNTATNAATARTGRWLPGITYEEYAKQMTESGIDPKYWGRRPPSK